MKLLIFTLCLRRFCSLIGCRILGACIFLIAGLGQSYAAVSGYVGTSQTANTELNTESNSYIEKVQQTGDFPLFDGSNVPPIIVDEADHKGVLRAAETLRKDFRAVTGIKPVLVHQQLNNEYLIIVGSLDKSPLIQQLAASGKLDLKEIEGQWDALSLQLVDAPFAGVKQALVIAGSDKRGTIYGMFDLAKHMGVSPWYWWADVPIERQPSLYVKALTKIVDQPKVKYRGIFLNDEAPALSGWVHEKFGDYNSQFYIHVFELLQRLKANFLWPAMWNNAFSDDDPQNMLLADEMGIVMSNSHHEPMMRADKEWNRYGEGPWEYSVNRDNIYKFWQEGARRHKDLESIFTLGMRGQQDEPMSEGENIGLLEQIVADQREILRQTFTDKSIKQVPQVWTLYKEVQGFYERGMRVPEDVILLWSDDNWGNIRRLPTAEERKRSGGAGVYYHFDYVGGPRSYRWINSTPIAKIYEQMQLAYQYQANQIWITNVGDLKPMELPISFFLDLAWNPEAITTAQLADYHRNWAAQQFGPKYAEQIAELLHGYTRHNGRRKAELMSAQTYSLLNYGEADRIAAEQRQLVAKAEVLYQQLPKSQQDAFFQLVLHPVKASAAIFQLYHNVAINHLYAKQGRASTNDYAQKARESFALDQDLKQQYHSLKDGRWNHFMAQTHIGYTHWNHPPADVMPALMINEPAPVADMGVAVEGSQRSWPEHGALALERFSRYGQQKRYIDVYNKGTKAFEFSATPSEKWIKVSQTKGTVTKDTRLWLEIDWQNAPTGKSSGEVFIKGTGWGGARVTFEVFNPQNSDIKGFVEANGYIAIEAAQGKMIGNSKDAFWQEIPLHGRTESSVTAITATDKSVLDWSSAPYLEYPVYLFNSGQIEVQTIVAPTLNFVPGRGLRFAISFDDKPPQTIDILANSTHKDWQNSVKDGVRYALSKHQLSAGQHKLRIYLIDPAVTIQKILINSGGLKPSYLGPPQSIYKR